MEFFIFYSQKINYYSVLCPNTYLFYVEYLLAHYESCNLLSHMGSLVCGHCVRFTQSSHVKYVLNMGAIFILCYSMFLFYWLSQVSQEPVRQPAFPDRKHF